METESLYRKGSGAGDHGVTDAIAFRPVEEPVVENNGNYNVDSLSDIFIENQGSWIVQVNHFTLLPGDTLKVLKRDIPYIGIRLRIRFLQAYAFSLPLAAFPSLYSGKRIFIAWIPKHK